MKIRKLDQKRNFCIEGHIVTFPFHYILGDCERQKVKKKKSLFPQQKKRKKKARNQILYKPF